MQARQLRISKTTAEIYAELEFIAHQKAELVKSEKALNEELIERYFQAINNKLEQKTQPYGVVSFDEDEFKIKFDTPKKVEWDQDKLQGLYEEIKKDGQDPTDYIEVKYNVPERLYSAWPRNLQDAFIEARTITPGNIKVTIERKED